MWELSNRTRFAAARTFARDRDGAEVLLVAVKATFTIGADGRLAVADAQVPVHFTPLHAGDPARSSLIHDADFALTRSRTDVLVIGNARAPHGRPTRVLEAAVRVGAWRKRIAVFGDRRWKRGFGGWSTTEPEPFVEMPLVHERAFGGTENAGAVECEDNPVGVGFGRGDREAEGSLLPNLEDPAAPMRSPEDRPRPMAFGPIPRAWPARRKLAGTFDERWHRERRPLVPHDFDDAFWQSAPADQQLALDGGEEVELTGVAARGPLRFELPRLRLALRSRLGGRLVDHAAALHTVLFDPDRERVVLVFASALPCHHELHALERTVVEEAVAA
jgi:hypothetical protein